MRSRYPLKLSKEECFALRTTDPNSWKFYLSDSERDGKYEIVEDPGNEMWTDEAKKAVLRGESCPACGGKETRETVCRGTETGLYFQRNFRCECVDFKDFQELVASRLPECLRSFGLSTLAWSPKSSLSPARQEKEIAFLREHPDDSYFFLGKPGTSKTTYAAALFRHALGRNFKDLRRYGYYCETGGWLWRLDGNHLFDTEVAYATADDKSVVKRDIDLDEIHWARKNGYRPVLLLEEIDKRRMTEFAANVLFRLVNAMDECDGQLILTTNLTMQGFRNLFMKSDIEQVRVTGEALLRRLTDPDKIRVRDYHV